MVVCVSQNNLVSVTFLPLVVELAHSVRVNGNQIEYLVEHQGHLVLVSSLLLSIEECDQVSFDKLIILEVHFVDICLITCVWHFLGDHLLQSSHSIAVVK